MIDTSLQKILPDISEQKEMHSAVYTLYVSARNRVRLKFPAMHIKKLAKRNIFDEFKTL